MILLSPDRKVARCLACAGLSDLEYLPSGDTALTRRAIKNSARHFVVLKFSRSRKRNERQGVLVEPAALVKAQEQCAQDDQERARARDRAVFARAKQEAKYLASFAERIRELYPCCPVGREHEISRHACEKHSGRVGRSAAAKKLFDHSVTLAVRAHIRHCETNYDELLHGMFKESAREQVAPAVDKIESMWSAPASRRRARTNPAAKEGAAG
jgi:hypothetical protein